MKDTKSLDVICLGRASVDLYGQQIGDRLQDISSFSKTLGGSSCNICFGAARLGLKSSMLTRVGDEQFGEFIREELSRAGVDTSHVVTDKERLTALAILSIKSKDEFPLLFYRADCADMAIDVDDFDEAYIASSKSLLITGTHFSTPHVDKVARQAIRYAKANNTKVVLDIDYRPVLWGLTRPGDGDNRFVIADSVTQHLQSIVPLCDLIVGTEEEVHIAGGTTDTVAALRTIRKLSAATIVLKRGAMGCSIFDGDIPASIDDAFFAEGVKVDILNVLGAGDAFMAGFLRGWLTGKDYQQTCTFANASGALVVSRHGCAPAIPTPEELDYYIAHQHQIKRPDLDPELNYLHRVTTRFPNDWGELCILAFDHRIQLVDMANKVGADISRIKPLKQLILSALQQVLGQQAHANQLANNQVGVLIDDTYGQDALNTVTGQNIWIGRPVELPASRPLELEGGRSIGSRLVTWPKEHVVKCLVFMHPDDEAEMWQVQSRQLLELYQACCVSGHELLLEVIPPKDMSSNDDTVVACMKMIYDLDIRPDWWKLPSPSKTAWAKMSDLIEQRSPHCRGVILLGLDAPFEELIQGFVDSASFPLCKGFAVGRSIFSGPSEAWLSNKISDDQLKQQIGQNYMTLVDAWNKRKEH
ncbi:MAG: 5-dehydro-2-deoxygluconokinase [Paraglaciecola sp.]|uniref:bifunctional 5-dehydro-2-deoxygluconokinase/5-dehydro-2- deoxyphosphogluconate aldolase n=1 Tax=Paraglaciecola sp. TaxID=1920173 RepID=UPI00326456D0